MEVIDTFSIRPALARDAAALVVLEGLSPEAARVAVRLDLRSDHFALARRYPGSVGYVAEATSNGPIIGMLFSSVAPTQINGKLVPAAYLFSLRVHPGYRRLGVASALISHSCEVARHIAGVRTAWAAIVEGNEPSLRTFHRLGFVRLRGLEARIAFAGLDRCWRRPRMLVREAQRADLPRLAEALNRFRASHNFWRPVTAAQLQTEIESLGHTLRDVAIVLREDSTILAAAGALEVARFARLRLVRVSGLPDWANRLLKPCFGMLPLNAILVRHCLFPQDQPAVGRMLVGLLHRKYLPGAMAATLVADPLDPSYAVLRELPGLTAKVHIVVKGDEPIDSTRPVHLS